MESSLMLEFRLSLEQKVTLYVVVDLYTADKTYLFCHKNSTQKIFKQVTVKTKSDL